MDATKSNYPKEWDAGISARYECCGLGTGVPTEYSKDQKHAWRAGWLSTIANGASISDEIREAYEHGFEDGVKSINTMEAASNMNQSSKGVESAGRIIIVCGATGAGKTTYSISFSEEIEVVRFSIDPWMQTLFAEDMKSVDYSWMIERVNRCSEQIWSISKQILRLRGNVVLDLGFTEKKQRDRFAEKTKELGIVPEVHYLAVPRDVRKKRVDKRNFEKDPKVYAFDVTNMMFDFMEPRFEVPGEKELEHGRLIEFDSESSADTN